MILLVIDMTKNEFDDEVKYKLFRSVQEILHPTISKKNISDYKIIVDENILPVRVFYPKKVSNLSQVLIFIHGNGKITDCQEKYSDICKELTMQTNSLTIAIEYEEEENYFEMISKLSDAVKYLYERLERDGIDCSKIVLVGDSTGAYFITAINSLSKKEIPIQKEILFYPVLSVDYSGKKKYESFEKNRSFNPHLLEDIEEYFRGINLRREALKNSFLPIEEMPKMLILVGKIDSLRDEIEAYWRQYQDKIEYLELPFASHGFLKKMDKELADEVFEKINEFMI